MKNEEAEMLKDNASHCKHKRELMEANVEEKDKEINEIKEKFKEHAQTSEDAQQK